VSQPEWRSPRWRPVRFLLNGLAAAAVHFAVLTCLLKVLALPSAGLANLFAAIVGVSASFVGNRHFVFGPAEEPWKHQLMRFWVLYLGLSVLHGGLLLFWTDVAGLDYRAGFLLGALLAALCTYLGGKRWVFRPAN
jgi:putative flippase GtrA